MKLHITDLSKFPSDIDHRLSPRYAYSTFWSYVCCEKSVITQEKFEVTLLLSLSALLCNFGKKMVKCFHLRGICRLLDIH